MLLDFDPGYHIFFAFQAPVILMHGLREVLSSIVIGIVNGNVIDIFMSVTVYNRTITCLRQPAFEPYESCRNRNGNTDRNSICDADKFCRFCVSPSVLGQSGDNVARIC